MAEERAMCLEITTSTVYLHGACGCGALPRAARGHNQDMCSHKHCTYKAGERHVFELVCSFCRILYWASTSTSRIWHVPRHSHNVEVSAARCWLHLRHHCLHKASVAALCQFAAYISFSENSGIRALGFGCSIGLFCCCSRTS